MARARRQYQPLRPNDRSRIVEMSWIEKTAAELMPLNACFNNPICQWYCMSLIAYDKCITSSTCDWYRINRREKKRTKQNGKTYLAFYNEMSIHRLVPTQTWLQSYEVCCWCKKQSFKHVFCKFFSHFNLIINFRLFSFFLSYFFHLNAVDLSFFFDRYTKKTTNRKISNF